MKEIEVIEYPASSKFMDYKSKKINDKKLNITRNGIYKFRFSNAAISGRVCKYKIQRIPSSDHTKNFNTNVYWHTKSDTSFFNEKENYLISKAYIPKTIIASSEHFINSGSNSLLLGGKSRITIPVSLPANTVEWYYQFSASRRKEDIAEVKGTFSLAGKLSNLIDQTGTISFGIEKLTQPPGADYCDIYLLNQGNSRLFEAKEAYSHFPIGTRENLKSGIVKLNSSIGGMPFLGIKNPDNNYGIHVVIECVAIVLQEEWGTRDVQRYSVVSREEPYLKTL